MQLEHPDEDEDEDEDEENCDEEMKDDKDIEDANMENSEWNTTDGNDSSSNSMQSTSSTSSPHSKAQTPPTPTSPAKKGEPGEGDIQGHREMDDDDDDDMFTPPNETILETRRQHPIFARLFRSKGELYLATRPHRAGEWSQAGAMLTLTGGRPWFCTLPPEEYTTGDKEVDGLVQHDISKGGEWGDRRQELVFIGERLNQKALESVLDECLLNDAEWADWQQVMRNEDLDDDQKRDALEDLFEDGFPAWPEEDEHDEDEDGHKGHNHHHHGAFQSIKPKS